MQTEIDNNVIAEINVHINAQKLNDMAPDLKGHFELQGKPLELAMWTRRTKKGDKIYHSFRVTTPYVKGETPTVLVQGDNAKLYEIESVVEGAPDFQSPAAFTLFGESCYAALWTVPGPDQDDPDDLIFELKLLRKPFSQKLTQKASDTALDVKERALERRKERELREQAAARDVAALHEELNMGDPELD